MHADTYRFCSGAPFVEVAHDSESSTGGSASSLPEDAALNPVKPSAPGEPKQAHYAICLLCSCHKVSAVVVSDPHRQSQKSRMCGNILKCKSFVAIFIVTSSICLTLMAHSHHHGGGKSVCMLYSNTQSTRPLQVVSKYRCCQSSSIACMGLATSQASFLVSWSCVLFCDGIL